MSYDLYFWPAGCTDNPHQLATQLATEQATAIEPDTGVLAFRTEVLRRWPELTDVIGPWHDDLGWRQPWGRTDLADRYAKFNLPYSWDHPDDLITVAGENGLDCWDPQTNELVLCDPAPVDASASQPNRAEAESGSTGSTVVT